MLFATLDPTLRVVTLPHGLKVIVSDTVGFISDLPTQLVAAFRATLEEVTGADVIVHVRDMANPSSSAQKTQVLDVLAELGIVEGEGGESSIPIVEAWNKIDLLPRTDRAEMLAAVVEEPDVVPISAATGEGVEALLARLDALLTAGAKVHEIVLSSGEGQKIAWLHAHGQVLDDRAEGGASGPVHRLKVRLTPKEFGRFESL
jgi:GTP-binding protein HflX